MKKEIVSKLWKINILALKRNVFFSLSDSNNKVKKLLTPGSLLKSSVRRDEYKKLDNKRDRRKKRSLRLFINNQKLTIPACVQTWNLLHNYIIEQKLQSQKFVLILGGSNLKMSLRLGQNFLKKVKLKIVQVITKIMPAHNGCPRKIKKRKKNKGRNKWVKRGVAQLQKKQLSIPRGYKSNNSVLLPNYQYERGPYLMQKDLKNTLSFSKKFSNK